MHALLQLLSEYQLEVETRAFAHYSSSKYHRRQGVLWGIAASGFTAFASLAALAGGASKLGAFPMFGTLSGSSGLFVIVFLGYHPICISNRIRSLGFPCTPETGRLAHGLLRRVLSCHATP